MGESFQSLDANPATLSVRADASRARRAVKLLTSAVVFEGGRRLDLRELELHPPGPDDIVIDVEWSGVSTGTERLLWSGEMPPFPGMGYPLVPGYEAVGRVVAADERAGLIGRMVFAPGARCFKNAHGLFGASASRIVTRADRVVPIDLPNAEEGVLLALAATARHAIAGGAPPDLVVGHGVLGRLIARVSIALGNPPPVVWEVDPERSDSDCYAVIEPECDGRTDYRSAYDASGDSSVIDEIVGRLAPRGEIVLAGFYVSRPSFAFAPAFMKEARLRIAAEWKREDLDSVLELISSGALSLEGLITHRMTVDNAAEAYSTAFEDPACLKMILDWRAA